MKHITKIFAFTLLSTTLSAADLCSKYANSPRMMKGIEVVAAYQMYSLEEFCNLPGVMDVEAQPSRILKGDEIIPHVRVQQHRAYDSCLYMVNETDYSITNARCYSGT